MFNKKKPLVKIHKLKDGLLNWRGSSGKKLDGCKIRYSYGSESWVVRNHGPKLLSLRQGCYYGCMGSIAKLLDSIRNKMGVNGF